MVIDNEVAIIRIIVNSFWLRLGGKRDILIHPIDSFYTCNLHTGKCCTDHLVPISWMALKQNLQNLINNSVWIRVSNGTGQRNFSGQRDSQNFFVPGQRDNGTEVPLLSRDKGTTGQAQNLAKVRDRPRQPVKIPKVTWDGMVQDFDS